MSRGEEERGRGGEGRGVEGRGGGETREVRNLGGEERTKKTNDLIEEFIGVTMEEECWSTCHPKFRRINYEEKEETEGKERKLSAI